MTHSFPLISGQNKPQAWTIAPDAATLVHLADGIWSCAKQTQQRPLVILSTAGPLMGLRIALEKQRPQDLSPQIAFLPQVISFNDWLELAPNAWQLPKKYSELERWLEVYATLKKHDKLQAWFKVESGTSSWGLAQAIITACDTLSASVAPRLQAELSELIKGSASNNIQDVLLGESWVNKTVSLLEETIANAYPELARKVLDREAQVLLTFWRYLSSASDPAFRKQFAMAAHLQQAKLNKTSQVISRPIIWMNTADPSPIEQEMMQAFLNDYAEYAPIVDIRLDWQTVALWAEAANESSAAMNNSLENAAEAQVKLNLQKYHSEHLQLIAAKRFEELAWATAKTIEQHLLAGKTNIALVAQDRLVARRTRALLTRLGPALKVQDETGWKLSTTRAAAALNSWLELMRSPKEGPTATDLLEFLKNPFFDLEKCLGKEPNTCIGVIAQLENILIASQAHTGWETFYLAIEGAGQYAVLNGSISPNPILLELLQRIRAKHFAWLPLQVDCASASKQLQADLDATGMFARLEKDAAGKQLLEVLGAFDLSKTSPISISMRFTEWQSLIKAVVESANYQELGQSAVATLTILPLSATRLREFEAVVMVGCDEQQLPAFSEPPLFFSDALNQLLKTGSIQAQFIQQARDLSQLLTSCTKVSLLWQSQSQTGEALRPSAWIQRLQAEISLEQVSKKMRKRSAQAQPMLQAKATLGPDIPMPLSMSPSAYKALRDCPYRYYVKNVLGLRKLKGFEEGFDASLAGQTLHRILRDFYQALKTVEHTNPQLKQDAQMRRAWMEQHLNSISENEFKRLIAGDARVLGTLRDWQKQIPSFVDWQLQRDAQGWEYFDGEVKVGFHLEFVGPEGETRHMRIEGYADRFDINTQVPHQAVVLDYKNQSFTKIKERAEHVLDDPQLLMYARAVNEHQGSEILAGYQVKQAEWVALKAKASDDGLNMPRAKEVEELPNILNAFSTQITQDVEQLWSKKPLIAFAPNGVCQYCEVRGICRKGMW
jgi:ATP-dependent helicase/nuclease subunit B